MNLRVARLLGMLACCAGAARAELSPSEAVIVSAGATTALGIAGIVAIRNATDDPDRNRGTLGVGLTLAGIGFGIAPSAGRLLTGAPAAGYILARLAVFVPIALILESKPNEWTVLAAVPLVGGIVSLAMVDIVLTPRDIAEMRTTRLGVVFQRNGVALAGRF